MPTKKNWERIDQTLVPHPDGSGTQVLLGWIHGHAHLQAFVDVIESGEAEPIIVNGKEWDSVGEFAHIAEHGYIRMYRRVLADGREQHCSHWDPDDPAHPRHSEF